VTDPGTAPPAGTARSGRLLGSATVLSAGNVASRLLGLVREQVIANDWGGSLEASAFRAAARVPTLLYDLLVGGMLSAALVPVLAAHAARDRDDFWRLASVLLSLAGAVCGAAALAVFALAPALARFLGSGYGPEGVALVEGSLRYVTPAILLFGLAGVLNGVLYALERFSLPAATGAVYNCAFIVAAVLLRHRLGVFALPVGVSLGALAQVAVLVPGLAGGRLRPRLDLRHPALRRVLTLYLPIAAGLVVSAVQVGVEPRLASRWGPAGLAWMGYATNLIQFPLGLIALAISAAILPRLAANHARAEHDAFASTLAHGLRAVLALTLPAAVGLAVLAEPIAGVVFQRGAFVAVDRVAVAWALYGYLAGLPFAAIDWPLNYAFYARQNTLVPAVVGVASVAAWYAVAHVAPPLFAARDGVAAGYMGLVVADSAKHALHAVLMLWLIARVTRGAGLEGLPRTLVVAAAASLGMAGAVALVDGALAAAVPAGTVGWALRTLAGVGVGVAVYVVLAGLLGLREIPWLLRQLRRRTANGGLSSPAE
jgi:putative peptidoglycan lipid II flippase